jgi:hypothetical protein
MTKSKQSNAVTMNRILLTLTLLALAGTGAFGQAKKEQAIKVSIYAFAYAKGPETVYLTDKKKEPEAIRLSNANILGPFKTELNEDGQVLIRSKRQNDEGATVYPPIAVVKIPSRVKEPLLILLPTPGIYPYQALVLDHSVANFPEGSYKLINFSPRDIRGLIGKTKVLVGAKKITSFDPSSNASDQLDVHFQYRRPNDWKTFGRTRWMKEKEKRHLLCAYIDPRTKRMKIRGLPIEKLSPASPAP